jgi:hypothetical protein
MGFDLSGSISPALVVIVFAGRCSTILMHLILFGQVKKVDLRRPERIHMKRLCIGVKKKGKTLKRSGMRSLKTNLA